MMWCCSPPKALFSPLCYALALGFAAFVEKELVRFRNSVEKESVSFVAERPWARRYRPCRASLCPLGPLGRLRSLSEQELLYYSLYKMW